MVYYRNDIMMVWKLQVIMHARGGFQRSMIHIVWTYRRGGEENNMMNRTIINKYGMKMTTLR